MTRMSARLDKSYDELLAENDQLRAAFEGTDILHADGDHTGLFVWAVIALSLLAMVSVVTVFVIRPDKDNTAVITVIVGFVVPTMTAFIAAAIREVHRGMNSRLSQLLLLTRTSSHAEGKLDERREQALLSTTGGNAP